MVLLIKVLIKHLPLKIPKWLIFLTLLPGGLGDAEDIGGVVGHMGLPGRRGGRMTTPPRKDIQEDDNPYFLDFKT